MADVKLSDGVTAEEISSEAHEKFCGSLHSFKSGFVRLQPYNQIMPRAFLPFEKEIKELDVRPDDVWVSSFPKCGI